MVSSQDADIFAYLCERPPDGGDLVYVTEGASNHQVPGVLFQ